MPGTVGADVLQRRVPVSSTKRPWRCAMPIWRSRSPVPISLRNPNLTEFCEPVLPVLVVIWMTPLPARAP